MAKPITWRTIAGPNFSSSAIGVANNAFRSASEGFSRFGEELFSAQDRADDQFTNQAVKQALETGQVDPNLNPRADSARVHDALLGLKTGESDLATAQANRALTAEQTDAAAYENTDDFRQFEREYKQAEVARKKAQTETEKRNADIRLQELNLIRDEYDQKKKTSEGIQALDSRLFDLKNEFATEIWNERFPEQAELTPQQMDEVWQAAVVRAEGTEGRRILKGVSKDLPSAAWQGSRMGQLDALADQSRAAISERRIEEEDEARRQGRLSQLYMDRGDYSRAVWKDGEVVPEESENELDAQKLSSQKEAIARLRTVGVKQTFSDDEKDVLEEVRQMFPNSSMFTQIVKSFSPKGKLDEESLREAARGTAEDLLLATQRRANATKYILQDADNPRTQIGRPRGAKDIFSGERRGSQAPRMRRRNNG